MLLAEAGALPPILRTLAAEAFDLPTVLPGWSVRDVLAHCSGAMSHVTAGTLHRFTPQDNEADVAVRRSWTIADLIDELVTGYRATAEAIDEANGRLDGLGLGEWIHGGDVRLALGRSDAYISAGSEFAVDLITERSESLAAPSVSVTIGSRRASFGVGDPVGTLTTDLATYVRIVSGRSPDPDAYDLVGADVAALVLFT